MDAQESVSARICVEGGVFAAAGGFGRAAAGDRGPAGGRWGSDFGQPVVSPVDCQFCSGDGGDAE